MLDTLRVICQENWKWRKQIWNLAKIDIVKTCRGAALGWIWLLIKPLTYIAVFWFALEMGLRAGKAVGDYPYLLWLCAGLIPWFFMQEMINTGSSIYKKYSFLVNRIHFPLSTISLFYALSQLLIDGMLILGMIIVTILTGTKVTVYVLQVPILILLMYLFWSLFSIMTSPLSAISKDFMNLLKALSSPLFWISGIIFPIASLDIAWLKVLLAFNPVTFFASAFRDAMCGEVWFWCDPMLFWPFVAVFVVTLLLALNNYGKLRKEVPDVL